MTTDQQKQSHWNADHTAYLTPDKQVVRVWNGPILWARRNSAQQQAQREIQRKGQENDNTSR